VNSVTNDHEKRRFNSYGNIQSLNSEAQRKLWSGMSQKDDLNFLATAPGTVTPWQTFCYK